MAKQRISTFVVAYSAAEKRFVGFLDMLRYDGAQVIEASAPYIVLSMRGNPPTDGRWASFGIYVLAQTEGDYPDLQYLKEIAKNRLP